MNKLYYLPLLLCYICLSFYPTFAQDYQILRVENVRDEWNKLKLGNNPNSYWKPKVDVTAGGNTHLEIAFRVSQGTPDMSRIQIRPNGYAANPVNFANYLPPDFSYGAEWYTISIPLTAFDPLIDLSSLYLLQLPYSNMAGTFVMEFRSITFTGGSSPYLWFGEGKRDIIHDGFGRPGQMIAAIEKEFYFNYTYDYPGLVGIDLLDVRGYLSLGNICQHVYANFVTGDEIRPLTPSPFPLSPDSCDILPGEYTTTVFLDNGEEYGSNFTIPDLDSFYIDVAVTPIAGDTINVDVTLVGGAGPYYQYAPVEDYFSEDFQNIQFVEYLDFDYSQQYLPDITIESDLRGNTYTLVDSILYKYDADGNLLWKRLFDNSGDFKLWVDTEGNAYIGGLAEPYYSIEDSYLGNALPAGFVLRLSSLGDLQWLRNLPYVPESLVGDGIGSLYAAGSDSVAFMSRLGTNGHLFWTKTGSMGSSQGADLTSDRKGNVYALIGMKGGGSFDGESVTGVPSDFNTGILFKTDSSGLIYWFRVLPYANRPIKIAAGHNDIVYTLYDYIAPLNYALPLRGYMEGFVEETGQNVFIKELGASYLGYQDLDLDPLGLPYVLDDNAHLVRRDVIGNELFDTYLPKIPFTPTSYLTIDGKGNMYITGTTNGPYFGMDSLYYKEGIYLAKIAPANSDSYTTTANQVIRVAQDARGNFFVYNEDITTTAITGINASLANDAYEIYWQPALAVHTGYQVYEKAGEQLALVGEVAEGVHHFTHYTSTEERPEYIIRVLTSQGENQSDPHSPAVLAASSETGGKVSLNWQAYAGYDDPGYTLYRGTDPYSMEAIGKFDKGQLSYQDKLPASGDYLYRLETKGSEGSSMSNTVTVSSESDQQEAVLWPNPATDIIHCRWEGRSPTNTLQLSDVQGRIVSSYTDIDPSGYQLQRGSLPAGVYLLTFEDANGKTTRRVIFK